MEPVDLAYLQNLVQKYGHATVLYEFAEMSARGGAPYERDLSDWLRQALSGSTQDIRNDCFWREGLDPS